MADAGKHPGNADFPPFSPATKDALAAISYVRSHAGDFGVKPSKIGLLGFSAGAITTLATVGASPENAANFIAPIYPQMNLKIDPPRPPAPMFLALASDDSLFGRQGVQIVEQWQTAGGSVEFHFYQGGEHGFALERRGTTSDHWFDEFMWWLEAQKLLPRSGG